MNYFTPQLIALGQSEDDILDEHGQPTNMLIVSPATAESLKKREAEWEQDRAFKAKVEEVKKRKKEEFDEREACRRLVD